MTWLLDVRDLDHGRLGETFQAAEAAGAKGLYFEAADGSDGSDFGFASDFIALAKQTCGLERIVHLRVARPERHIAAYVEAGAETLAVPVESAGHLQRTLTVIREAGVTPAAAINPGTPLTKLQYVLPFVGALLVLAAEPGAIQTSSTTFERVEILKRNIDHQKLRVRIIVGGLRTAAETHTAIAHGASGVVVSGGSGRDALQTFKELNQTTPSQN